MSDINIFNNPQLLREKCILLGRILDELKNHGNMPRAINTTLPNEDNCPIHNEIYEYYDSVCDQVICRHCATTTHEGHVKVMITEKAQNIRENDFSGVQNHLTSIMDYYKRISGELMKRRDENLQTNNTYQQQIHSLFQKVNRFR